MRPRALGALLGLVACEPRVVAPEPEPRAFAGLDASTADVARPSVAEERPFTVAPPLRFTVERGAAKVTPLPFTSSSGATFGPDGRTFVVDVIEPHRTGALVVSPSNPSGAFFATREVHDVRFSPSGRRVLVLDDETRTVTVLSVPDGQVLASARPAWVARFRGEEFVPFWDGCKVMELAVATGATRPVSSPECGGASASDDGRTFVVASPSRTGVTLERTPYQRLSFVDAETGAADVIAESPAGDVTSIRLAPSGTVVCFDEHGFRCRRRGASAPLVVPPGASTSLVFSDDGTKMLYRSSGALVVADFAARTATELDLAALASPELRHFDFFPSGTRIIVYQAGAWACDLRTAVCLEIVPTSVEPGGFAPSNDRTFLLGIEAGATRRFSKVELAR